jgi:signal transduction histidine kinase
MVETLKNSNHLSEIQIEARNRKGENLILLSSAEMVELEGQQCILRVSRDITRQKLLEEQFRQSQKMEAIGQLAGGIAHDFNNILAVIHLQVDMMKVMCAPSPQQLEFVEIIGAASQRAASLTRQLLMFSRKQAIRKHDLDLNKSITDVTKLLHRTLGESVRMYFKFSAEPLHILADPGRTNGLGLD